MVVVLHNQFSHLGEGVGAALGYMLGDVGDFCPRHKAVFIAQVVEILRVLVVGQAHGVRAHLAQQGHILVVLFFGQCVAKALAVLMSRCAAQAVGAVVQDKALLRVKGNRAAAEIGFHGIAAIERGLHFVQIRVIDAIPQVDVFELERAFRLAVCDRRGKRFFAQRELHALRGAGNQRLGVNFSGFQIGAQHRGDAQTGRAVVVQRKVRLGHNQQMHRAVDAAVEGEVGLLRVDRAVFAVVHGDGQGVLRRQRGRQIDTEGGVAALMPGQLLPVQRDHGGHGNALKFQPDLLAVTVVGGLKRLCIKAGAAVVVIAAVLSVLGVPGVGQCDRGCFLGGVPACKQPVTVPQNLFSHHPKLLAIIYDSPPGNTAGCPR